MQIFESYNDFQIQLRNHDGPNEIVLDGFQVKSSYHNEFTTRKSKFLESTSKILMCCWIKLRNQMNRVIFDILDEVERNFFEETLQESPR